MSTSSPENAPLRPPQVTLFGWMVIISAVIVVLSAWETVANARSLETTETLRRLIEEPPFQSLGLEQLRTVHRISAIVAAAAAGGAAVFAVHVLRRDRIARLAVSVLAVPVLLAGFIMGGLSTTLLAVAAMMLWLQPSRDWFDGKDYAPPEPRETAAPDSAERGGATWAPPTAGERRPDGSLSAPAAASTTPRPRALMRACLVAGAFSVVTLALTLIALVALVSNSAGVLAEVRRQDPSVFQQGVSEQQLLTMVGVVLGLLALWCLVGATVSYIAFRGAEWARVALMVISVISGVLALAASLVNPVLLVVAAASVLAAALLARREVVAWSRDRSRTGSLDRDPMSR